MKKATDGPVPTLTHPTMEWKLSNDDESTTTIRAEYKFALPTVPYPAMAEGERPWRHPYPNCFTFVISREDGQRSATLSRAEAERVYQALGDALNWDGQ